LELDPNMREALSNYARSEFFLGRAEKAIPVLEKLAKQNAKDIPTLFMLACAYCCCFEEEKASSCFDKLENLPSVGGKAGLAISMQEMANNLNFAEQDGYAKRVLNLAKLRRYVNSDVLDLSAKPDV